jgi:hypothetical protein
MRQQGFLGFVALIASTGACAGSGGMRQATLGGQCAADDAACAKRHPMAPLAIGARFYPDVSTELDGTTPPNLRLESADPNILDVEGAALVARSPGTAAVLITTDDGSVVDFVHVWVAPVSSVSIARRDGERIDGAIGLVAGEDVTLVPTLWSGAQRLSGDAGAVWSVDNPGAVTVLRDGSSDRRRLRARAPGRATVKVAIGNAASSVDIEVAP